MKNRTPEDARHHPIPGDRFVYHSGPCSDEVVQRVENGRVWVRSKYENPAWDGEADMVLSDWSAHPLAGVWVPA